LVARRWVVGFLNDRDHLWDHLRAEEVLRHTLVEELLLADPNYQGLFRRLDTTITCTSFWLLLALFEEVVDLADHAPFAQVVFFFVSGFLGIP
jgi:hypothetical protein